MLYALAAALTGLGALFVLACRAFPGLAEGWLLRGFAPVSAAIAPLVSRVAFPLAEIACVLLLAGGIWLAVRSRRGACLLLAALALTYALFWAPLYFVPAHFAVPAAVDARALEALCRELTDELNQRGAFAMPEDMLERAGEVAALAETPAAVRAVPKYARYPEWMRGLSLAGIYVPWTFEALVNPLEAAPGQPFTAVHELMHLGGVADEGQANIYAYKACLRAGGAFAHSARLWALKYAMAALREVDAAAWNACAARLEPSVRADFVAIGGFALPATGDRGVATVFLRLGGIEEQAGNYDALARWLCAREQT